MMATGGVAIVADLRRNLIQGGVAHFFLWRSVNVKQPLKNWEDLVGVSNKPACGTFVETGRR